MIGRRLAQYEILEKLGEGGMGVVWKARDVTLDREVAVKVLPEAFALDPDRLARFEREAKLLASLNHPNIAAIYGVHDQDGLRFLAMELVRGETLAARIARGRLAPAEARDVARQIAEALEAAHESGMVHRDLKPANVQVDPEGRVKVLDFGLAKALDPAGVSGVANVTHSPTMTAATGAGVILGTASYMSPEQARGRAVDRRADVWAFGCVLYEMLTGRQTFGGETVSDVLASVLAREPDWDALPANTPPALGRLMRRCLERDARRRLRDIGEARIVLEDPAVLEFAPTVAGRAPEHGGRSWLPLVAVALLIAAGAAVAGWWLKPVPAEPVRRLMLAAPREVTPPRQVPRISPDGRAMAYVADGKLWVQEFDRLTARTIAGGEDATHVVWSPDSGALAFVARGSLWRTLPNGDPARITAAPESISSAGDLGWSDDGHVVFTSGDSNVWAVPVQGGSVSVLVAPDRPDDEDFHDASTLPGNRGVLFATHRDTGTDSIEAFAGGERHLVLRIADANIQRPRWSPTGHLLFERRDEQTGIWAVSFSLGDLKTSGEPFLVVAGGGGHASVSNDGTLLYSSVANMGFQQIVLTDLEGGIARRLGQPVTHADNLRLAPDGERYAVCLHEGSTTNVWVHELNRDMRTRIAFDVSCGGRDGTLAWTADSTAVAYTDKDKRIRLARLDGTPQETPLAEGAEPDLSRDGRFMLFTRSSETTKSDVWALDLEAGTEPVPWIASTGDDRQPVISPAGNLLAWVSDETGSAEVYVRAFPAGTGRRQVSSAGGDFPRWSPTGDRLFYLQDENQVMAVSVTGGERVELAAPRELFSAVRHMLGLEHGADVAPDGAGLLTIELGDVNAGGGDLTLELGWGRSLARAR